MCDLEVDLRALRFVDAINDNLICCICQTPFVDPMITQCGHTFCSFCIHQALESSLLCPIDRTVLSLNEFQPAAKIISNMVNELRVYCPRHEQGCQHIDQRQFIESHLKSDCEYTMAPCKLEECKELLLKKDLGTHAETCKYRLLDCNMCKKKFRSYEIENHYSLCPAEIIECQYCQTSRPRSEHVSHINECPQFNVSCTYAEFGCSWNDERQNLKKHISVCTYESIKSYLHKQQQTERNMRAELQQIHKENESLKRQQSESRHQVESIVNQLDFMFPGHFISDPAIPEDARNESILSESQRMNSELETLSANIASLELKQNMALMTETFRLQEELQSLRAICHGLRMQMHYVMMDRRASTTTSSSVIGGGGGGGGPSGSGSGSNNSTTSAIVNMNNSNDIGSNSSGTLNSLNKMRSWLDKSNSRQETKL